ncbi:acyl-CoA N-acyltransferase [Athelia psychrophila]|uniref:Acyl-CoA N-acyltransferase n=1 Tax=Athelia psychrophila TaxID=1759441 RepID=A0A166X275_9AGAM|nr:acyl-CoA N-acyltransferase [Fibularhizoctonia sp. CBS 109695]
MSQHQITLRSLKGRVILVPPNAADDALNAALRADPTTRQYLPYFPQTFSAEEARALREKRAAAGYLNFNVHLVNPDGTTTFIGTTGFHNIDDQHGSAEIGIIISPDHQRGGIATETLYTLLQFGFGERKYHRIVFETGADNAMMKGWLEKVVGAAQEFRKREHWKTSAGYGDVVGYSLLAWEWSGGMKARLESRLQIGQHPSKVQEAINIQG